MVAGASQRETGGQHLLRGSDVYRMMGTVLRKRRWPTADSDSLPFQCEGVLFQCERLQRETKMSADLVERGSE